MMSVHAKDVAHLIAAAALSAMLAACGGGTNGAPPTDAPSDTASAGAANPADTPVDALRRQRLTTTTYSVGGSVSGLNSGASLTLLNNGSNSLALSANGTFTFSTKWADASTYTVTVATQPMGQTCTVSNASGTISGANVTHVSVACVSNPVTTYSVGGSVSGLNSGASLTLLNNGANPLVLSTNGAFNFSTKLADATTYTVTVATQPVGQTCTLSNASGTLSGANVTTIGVTCTTNLTATPPCVGPVQCRRTYPLASGGRVPYFGNYALDIGHPSAQSAVVVVHGTDRNAVDYYDYVADSAQATVGLGNVVVIAPSFQASAAADSQEFYWPQNDWREGGDGLINASAPGISSYAALDAIVTALADRSRFPALTQVVITGHSAGGQVVQRYAAGARATPAGLTLRYAPANPSSFMVLNAYRYVDGAFRTSGATFSACTSYNDYKYGLAARTSIPYMAAPSAAQLTNQYLARSVTYLQGTSDTCNSDLAACNDHSMDKTCEAMLEGAHRYERGQHFYAHLNAFFPGHAHVFQNVAGVGHDGRAMFNSPEARAVLFKF